MKKLVYLLVVAVISAFTVQSFAQSAIDLAKKRNKLSKVLKENEIKPNKDEKKLAKKYEREGWTVPVGEKSIAYQIAMSNYYADQEMVDEELEGEDNNIPRYISSSSTAKAGTYNMANTAARTTAQATIASLISTDIISTLTDTNGNVQTNANQVESLDEMIQELKSITNQSLTGGVQVGAMYRMDENGNYEVQIRLAYDKKILMANMKKKLAKEFGEEADELFDIVRETMRKNYNQ
ncbi:MAG: hypothetical protein IKD40_01205 [Bacteroidaceae bacterium]|nr:hypothetical protein [Bacteroidaceae bacterium]